MKADPLWRLSPLLALFLASCAFAGFVGVPRRVAFNEADVASYAGPGTASVTGQLSCSYEGEDHPGQGTPVTLLPVTAYAKEMIDRELGDGVTLMPSDSRPSPMRITKATSLSARFPLGSISSPAKRDGTRPTTNCTSGPASA